jgi:hypothetical protein
MKLNTAGISIIRGNKAIKDKIRDSLDVSSATMYKYVADNDEILTQAAVLKILREETGLSDQEILEEEVVKA